jgi:hypothetical protein
MFSVQVQDRCGKIETDVKKDKETRIVFRILCYVLFCFLFPRVQHDVRIADNLSKSL